MHQRKQFREHVDVNEFKDINCDLESRHKLRIFVCEYRNIPIAAIIVSVIGNKGIYLLGASNDMGRELKGSYLLQWNAIEWLKANGCKWYDLGGIDPVKNKGTYDFKSGLSGKTGKDLYQVGQFDLAPNLFTKLMVRMADRLRQFVR